MIERREGDRARDGGDERCGEQRKLAALGDAVDADLPEAARPESPHRALDAFDGYLHELVRQSGRVPVADPQRGEALLGEARPQVARDVLVALAPSQHDDRLAGETLSAACRLVEEAAEPIAFD